MVAAILQLTTTGLQDTYLTKDPEINIFKYTYYRYANFATELIKLPLNDTVDFGRNNSCDIPKKGHLLSKLFLHVKLPKLEKVDGTYLSWTDTIGYAMFKGGIDLEIGGVIVDTFYPQFYDMYDSFTDSDNDLGSNLLLLRGDTFVSARTNATKENDLLIPLKFWFTKMYNLSLPLVSMPHQSIRVKFKLLNFQECINYDGTIPPDYQITSANIFAEYIYLDDIILDSFSRQKHEYLVEQIQYNGNDVVTANEGIHSSSLVFNNPCKQLVFSCVETANINDNNYLNYSRRSNNETLIDSISLTIDGHTRFENTPEVFFRLAYPKMLHSAVPLKFVYTLPFCIDPEKNQPTGSLNMSNFDNIVMTLKMVKNNPECLFYIYSVMYNVVTVNDGLLSFKFSY